MPCLFLFNTLDRHLYRQSFQSPNTTYQRQISSFEVLSMEPSGTHSQPLSLPVFLLRGLPHIPYPTNRIHAISIREFQYWQLHVLCFHVSHVLNVHSLACESQSYLGNLCLCIIGRGDEVGVDVLEYDAVKFRGDAYKRT